jgi:hypothetical protein
MSPTCISSTSFSLSDFFSFTNAFFAQSSRSFPIASHAFVFALCSRYFPKLISVMMDTAASKYTASQWKNIAIIE